MLSLRDDIGSFRRLQEQEVVVDGHRRLDLRLDRDLRGHGCLVLGILHVHH